MIPAGRTISISSLAGAATTIVDCSAVDSVFFISTGANVTLIGLTIQNGNADYGGGIENQGDLTLNNSVVANNTANIGCGGIDNNQGAVTINDTVITANIAAYFGGGINNYLGAM